MYTWLLGRLDEAFESVRTLKESPRGSVTRKDLGVRMN